jgi:type IV secretory pathway protease TraF
MNRIKAIILACFLAVSLVAVAAEKAVSVTVPSATQVNGKPLAAGSYKVSWTGSDAAVQVTFKQDKKVIAEAPAKLVDGDSVSARNMLLLNEGGSLKELRLAGKKSVLKFN